MRTVSYSTDLCVVGGGMAGLCCAVAAARHGIKVILVQDRPVLGGNASSEIRMWIGGAYRSGQTGVTDIREGGIIEEIFLENFYQNPSLKYPIWDSVLYEKAMAEENLTLLLNTSCLDATMDGNRIDSIKAWQSNAETFHLIKATYFADCSGDSILAPLSGAKYMYGREAKSDFGETIPPDVADKKTMGMSCLMQIRETDHKVDFIPPKWAYKYETDEELPAEHTPTTNFWWIEVGGEWDCIHDTDRCRDELLKICYGVWDHMKNYGDHGVDNWELEWIGFLPGKRESRRYVGKHIVTQNDVESEGRFDDLVAFGGWTMDDHFPEGFYYRKGISTTTHHPAPQPWGLPLRCMISENIENLVFAGRNISVTHAALSSSRVMATCAVLGQALGTAVAQAIGDNCRIGEVDIPRLQRTLMDDDCFIPRHIRERSELTLKASCSSEVVRIGIDRGKDNLWIGKAGDSVRYTFAEDTKISELRLVFDSDMNRKYHNMPCNYPLKQTRFKLPSTLIKEYKIEGKNSRGEKFEISVSDNHERLVRHAVDWTVSEIAFIPLSTHGSEDMRLFGFEIK